MKLSLLAGVAVAAMMLAAPEASASGYKPYVSVFGGAAILTKNPHGTLTTSDGTSDGASVDLLMNNPGYIIGGAVGVDWGNKIRTEIELSHARWTSDKYRYATFDGSNAGTSQASSDVSATYLLGNAWLDLSQGSRITPYVGGGVGIGWASVNAFTNSSGPFANESFSATGLAFQIGAGVRFDLSENVVIDAGYRFKDIVGLNYPSYNGGLYIGTLTDTSLASHNFQVGLTFKF